MKATETCVESLSFQRALCRDCEDRPLLRYVAKSETGRIIIATDRSLAQLKQGVDETIGWPEKDIYCYSEAGKVEIENALATGDKLLIAQAWANQKRPF